MSTRILQDATRILAQANPLVDEPTPVDRALAEATHIGFLVKDVQLGLMIRAMTGDGRPLAAADKKLRSVLTVVNTHSMAPVFVGHRTERIPDAPVMPKARPTKASRKAQKEVNSKIAAQKKDGLDRRLEELRAEAAQQTLPPEPRELNKQHLWEDGIIDDCDV